MTIRFGIFCIFLILFRLSGQCYFHPLVTDVILDSVNLNSEINGITEDENGILFIDSENGIIRYDGYNQDVIGFSGDKPVNALLSISGKLLVGGIREFGVYERDSFGQFFYTRIAGTKEMDSDEFIINIISWGDKAAVLSNKNVYGYNPTSDSFLKLDFRPPHTEKGKNTVFLPKAIFAGNGSLYCQTREGEVYRYSDEGWSSYWEDTFLNGVIRTVIIPDSYRRNSTDLPENTIIITDSDLYKIEKGSLAEYKIKAIEDTKKEITGAVLSGPGDLFIGIYGEGIFQIDKSGQLVNHYSSKNELSSNYVKSLFLSSVTNNLFVVHDAGLSMLHLTLPIEVSLNNDPQTEIGRVLDLVIWEESLLVATNSGVFKLSDKYENFLAAERKINSLKRFDNQLFIGEENKSYILDANGIKNVIEFGCRSVGKFRINGEDIILQTDGKRIGYYKKNDKDDWKFFGIIGESSCEISDFEIDNDGSFWGAGRDSGFLHILFSNKLDGLSSLKFYPGLQNDSVAEKGRIMKIKGKTIFSGSSGMKFFDEASNGFMEATTLFGERIFLGPLKSVQMIDDIHYWLKSGENYLLIDFGESVTVDFAITDAIFPENHQPTDGGSLFSGNKIFFPLKGGVAQLDLSMLKHSLETYKFSLNFIGYYNKKGNSIHVPLPEGKRIKINCRNIFLSFNHPNYNKYPYRYKFVLKGDGEDVEIIRKTPEIEFKELNYGNYNLECSVMALSGETFDTHNYNFTVMAPWPLRWWAFLIYIAFGIVIVFFISLYLTKQRMSEERKQFEQDKYKRDSMIREQALIIANQQKKWHTRHLSAKSEELAQFGLNADRSQMVIDELKKSLILRRKKGEGVQQLEKILKEISATNGDNRLFWDILHRNFLIIHEDLFERLSNKFPELSEADLKFCALLRLKLTTKEIATFTSLSVRGVETARYRLRKKFGLDEKITLTGFLSEFQ